MDYDSWKLDNGDEDLSVCIICDDLFDSEIMDDGICPYCKETITTEEE